MQNPDMLNVPDSVLNGAMQEAVAFVQNNKDEWIEPGIKSQIDLFISQNVPDLPVTVGLNSFVAGFAYGLIVSREFQKRTAMLN